jgi:carbon storage regulator
MLVLSRKSNQQLIIGGCIRITVLRISGGKVRLGLEAPAEMAIHRPEVAKQSPRPRPHQGETDRPT